MSTYNGELFIKEQIDSILSQSFSQFTLYIRDDGSNDATLKIINEYTDPRVVLVKDQLGNLGSSRSFLTLLKSVNSDVYFFCDQDDIWLPQKLETVLPYFKENSSMPVLVHSDLELVDRAKKPLGSTFNQHENIQIPADYKLQQLLTQNCVVGCSSALNAALLAKAHLAEIKIEKIAMHDWWLSLVAARFGKIFYIDTPLVLYRQHSSNVSGASKKNYVRKLQSFMNGEGFAKLQKYGKRVANQAEEFLNTFSTQLAPREQKSVHAFCMGYSNRSFLCYLKSYFEGYRFKRSYMNFSFFISLINEKILSKL